MTIEERAREYSLKDFDGYYSGWEKDVEEGYIAGATDQKAVDEERIAKLESFVERATKLIEAEKVFREHLEAKEKKLIDKACKWLKENARDYACATIRYYGDEDEIICDVHQEIVEDFRKAMDEEL